MKRTLLLLFSFLDASVGIVANAPPIVFQKLVNIDKKWQANVVIREGQEPSEIIYSTLRPYGVNYDARRTIFDEVKRAGIPYSREFAQLYSQSIVLDDGSFSGTFTFDDNGSEPIDVIYNFAKEHSIDAHFNGLVDSLLPKLCELVPCRRRKPRVWFHDIATDDGSTLGVLEVLDGDEPIYSIDSFVQKISVDVGDRRAFRANVLNEVCKSITCSRSVPVVFRKAIKDQDGRSQGDIEIFEHEEVIDAVVRFIRKSKLVLDEIALKNYMLNQACRLNRVMCTRNVGVVYNQRITDGNGSTINTLIVYENEEPADKVYQWCRENNLAIGYMESIMNAVCDSELVVCKRREPVYHSIPISGPGGDYVNTLELKVGHEPVDDIYGFFASNGLFAKGWDMKSVVNQVCNQPNVDCRRLKAVKHFDSNFTMGGIETGQLVIWEDEEVVDVLYGIRTHHNLTAVDQIVEFNAICKKPEVECQRNRAVVFQKTEITKLDYEKFGNETCKRQFVGVKFRSTFIALPFGSKMAELLKEDSVKLVVEHPLFCVSVLFLFLVSLHAVACMPRLRGRVHPSQRVVVAALIVLLVSALQAVLVEPDTDIDKAMHVYEGKLPDIVILEGEEPVDALLKWGKLAAKDHHPIVREPIYVEIFDELCHKTDNLNCTRTRAWEFLNLGSMKYFGDEYPIDIYNPDVDPIARKECHPIMDGKANKCIEKAASRFCDRFDPPPEACVKDITLHIADQISAIDKKRFDAKCSYKRLGLEMDAPGFELYKKVALIALERKMNMSPFRRVDNGTVAFDKWSMEKAEAHTAIDTFQKIRDPFRREWNDKPCVPCE
jgi:hypothetical protein